MSFHTLAFSSSIAASTSMLEVTPVQDDEITISNNGFLPQDDYNISLAALMCVDVDSARIVSPELRRLSLPFIRPVMTSLVPPTDPNVQDFRQSPLRIKGLEILKMEMFHSNVGAQVATGMLNIYKQFRPAPQGNIITMEGISTTAAVANAWQNIDVTWPDTLPAGNYACVGLVHQSTTGKMCRLNFEGQTERPGSLSVSALANRTWGGFLAGGLGEWGRFTSTRMPIVQVFCNTTDAAHHVYLQFVKIP